MSGQARRVSALFYLAVLLITVVPGRAPAQSETATWTGTSGNWTTPSIWTTAPIAGLFPNNGQPAGTTYTVQVAGSGTITLNTTITVDQLGFNSGTITVPTAGLLNALVLNNNLTWGGGTFLGNAGGNSISVNANGGVTFPGGGLPILDAGALFIRGTTSTWSGGNITLQNGAILTNSFGSTLTASGNGTINLGGTSTLTSINNSGTFIKAGGTDMTAVMPPVTNNGVFAAATGLLTTNGIFTNNGTLLAAGGTIQINGPLNNLISGTLSGGTYQVQANSNLFLNGTVTTIRPNTTVGAGRIQFHLRADQLCQFHQRHVSADGRPIVHHCGQPYPWQHWTSHGRHLGRADRSQPGGQRQSEYQRAGTNSERSGHCFWNDGHQQHVLGRRRTASRGTNFCPLARPASSRSRASSVNR